MLCREVRSLMSSYLDNQLEREQIRQIEEHLTGCDKCRGRLEIMQQIPVALQTDRMLAPRPEFTSLVMQRIVVQEQVGSTRREIRYTSTTVEYVSQPQSREKRTVPETDEEPEPAKIISLADRRAARRPNSTSELALRMSALAAALVLMVGAGIYIAATGPTGTSEASTAAVYSAIKDFGDSLRNALGSPVELLVGIIITGVVVLGVWYMYKAFRREDGPARTRQEQSNFES